MTSERFTPEPNTYHVTSLTSCLKKTYFERTSLVEETIESAWSKLRGSLIHRVGYFLGWNELRVKTTFNLDSQTISIVGYIDAYDVETSTIYDLKTTRFVKWQEEKGFIPRKNHIRQIQCYCTLLSLYNIPVRRLVLIYVDDKNILAKQVPVCDLQEWMIQRATILSRAPTNSEQPEAEPDSYCTYCQLNQVCSNDNLTKSKEVMS